MNVIFFSIFTISVLYLSFSSPDTVMLAMLSGGEKAILLSVKILVVYSVWMGVLNVMEQTDITNKICKLLKPVVVKLFKCTNIETQNTICLNLTANLLGMGGVATPTGINAMHLLEKNGNHNGMCMLFVITATSIQILPTTIISLRGALNSVNATDIFLPSLICTAISTSIGILLVKIFCREKR